MKSFVLSPLHQVEYAVPDLEESHRFFIEVFEEKEVEAAFSAVLANPALAIRHAGFGGTVQQLCEPLMEGLPHYDALQAQGPCVHNLCYLVDDIDAIVANCDDAGFEVLIDFPLTDIWRSVLEESNITGNPQSCIMATSDLFGFQLELAETPWKTEPQPPVMLPAHGPQWSSAGVASGNTVLAINVVVNDLEATLHALTAVFGDNLRVINPPAMNQSGDAKTLLVELGKVPLAYYQPTAHETELATFLAQRGPAVHSLVAAVEGMGDIQKRLAQWNIETGEAQFALQLDSSEGNDSAATNTPQNLMHVKSLEQVGVNFLLLETVGGR